MLEKIKHLWNRYKYKGAELTPKGQCFKHYCEQIYDDTLESTISAYEDFLWYIRDLVAEDFGLLLDKKETAEFILKSYEEIL